MNSKPETKGDDDTANAEPADDVPKVEFERDPFIRYTAMSVEAAEAFLGSDKTALVVDKGPADPQRHRKGARLFHVYSLDHISRPTALRHAAQNTKAR